MTTTDVTSSASAAVVDTAGEQILAFGNNQSGQLGTGGSATNALAFRLPMVVLPDGVEVVDVAAGYEHGLALTDDGRLLAWGDNTYGQLGDGTFDPHETPVEITIAGASDVVAVAASGSNSSMALTLDGDVYVWGSNSQGQLGTGAAGANSPVAELVQISWSALGLPGDTEITAIAATGTGCLALTSTGKVIFWGATLPSPIYPPMVVPLPSPAVSISGGFNFLALATADGKLYTGDASGPFEVPLPDQAQVTTMAAGSGVFVAITSDGRLVAGGNNQYGQLGDGTNNNSEVVVWVQLPAGVTVTRVSVGYTHVLAVTSTGRMLAWGLNSSGQLGVLLLPLPATQRSYVPIWVDQPAGTAPAAIAAGAYFNLVAVATAPALAWGSNSYGQLGTGDNTPSNLPRLVDVPADLAGVMGELDLVYLENGYNHSLGVTTSGEVYAWGDNTYGQLGNGQMGTTSNVPVKVQMPADTTVLMVAGGQYHSAALTNDGRVFTWGRNNRGQLGLGDSAPGQVSTPQQVNNLPAAARDLSSHNLHTLAVIGGDVYAWGDNSWGQVGDGTTGNIRTAPVKVMSKAFRVGAGGTHSIAVDMYGKLWGWGYNYYGQLGAGDSGAGSDKLTPTAAVMPGQYTDTKFRAVATGLTHSMALSEDGVVFTCGNNSNGQLGNGALTAINPEYNPIDATGLPANTTFGAIGAGHFHSLTTTLQGKAYAWGSNANGQLGTGQAGNARNPSPLEVSAPADTGVTILTGGKEHTIII